MKLQDQPVTPEASAAISIVPSGTGVPNNPPRLVSEKEAARQIGFSVQYQIKWRFLGNPVVPFTRHGRTIRYRQSDIDAFIQNGVVASAEPHRRYDADRRTT